MLTVAIPKRNKLQNIIVLTPKDGNQKGAGVLENDVAKRERVSYNTCLSELS